MIPIFEDHAGFHVVRYGRFLSLVTEAIVSLCKDREIPKNF